MLFMEQRALLEVDYLVMHRVLDPVQARVSPRCPSAY